MSQQSCLALIAVNQQAMVCHVADQSTEMLEILKHKHISIGTRLEVKKKFEFDHSMEIKIRQQPAFTISEQLAKNIFVSYV